MAYCKLLLIWTLPSQSHTHLRTRVSHSSMLISILRSSSSSTKRVNSISLYWRTISQTTIFWLPQQSACLTKIVTPQNSKVSNTISTLLQSIRLTVNCSTSRCTSFTVSSKTKIRKLNLQTVSWASSLRLYQMTSNSPITVLQTITTTFCEECSSNPKGDKDQRRRCWT